VISSVILVLKIILLLKAGSCESVIQINVLWSTANRKKSQVKALVLHMTIQRVAEAAMIKQQQQQITMS
jgi:hypothetical protein